jgi:hypothetical protein
MTEHGTDIDSLVAIGETLAEVSGLETGGFELGDCTSRLGLVKWSAIYSS